MDIATEVMGIPSFGELGGGKKKKDDKKDSFSGFMSQNFSSGLLGDIQSQIGGGSKSSNGYGDQKISSPKNKN